MIKPPAKMKMMKPAPHRIQCVVGWFELCQPDGVLTFQTFERFPQSCRTMRVIAAVMRSLGDELR